MKIPVSRECWLCGDAFMGTYKSRYCTDAHRQKAYRQRCKIIANESILDQWTIL